ncbi:O-methyltransferase [Aspergillus lucknowensis]|uniref:O-methyltransferase n=1 Tax=Aspergillus lucknowensis TaxID=176173 RepID=A0ABR4M4G3_9EURO
MSSQSPNPLSAPIHILSLLKDLHKKSLDQEAQLAKRDNGKVFSDKIISDLEDQHQEQQQKHPNDSTSHSSTAAEFDALMLDKFIALDEDKCQFMYQLITAMGATNVVEAGTSFGVSTIYLALGVGRVKSATGKGGVVIATEKEKAKADVARGYWAQCGKVVEDEIDLRVGDLLETLRVDLPREIDLLLLDIWSALALPTLKTVLPRLRPGAVVLTDNTISSAKGYADLLAFLRNPENGFQNMTLPFTNGFEMSVYLPKS